MNLKRNSEVREAIATSHAVAEFRKCVDALKTIFEPYHEGKEVFTEDPDGETTKERDFNLRLPPWICQPYIRMEPEEHIKLVAEKQRIADDPERLKKEYFDDEGQQISRKMMKKLRRSSRRPNPKGMRCKAERVLPLCSNSVECVNPMVIYKKLPKCRISFQSIFFSILGYKVCIRIMSGMLS